MFVPVLALMILAFAFCIGGILIIYNLIYNFRIKKRMERGETGGRQWPTPKNVLFVVLVAAVIIALIITALNVMAVDTFVNNTSSGTHEVIENAVCSSQFYRSEDLLQSELSVFAEIYPDGNLEGYERNERTEGDFRYIVYKNGSYNSLMPDFVAFVEYVGDGEFEKVVQYTFMEQGRSQIANSAGSCEDVSDYYFIAGNFSDDTTGCTQSIGLYKDAEKAQQDIESDKEDLLNADVAIEINIK